MTTTSMQRVSGRWALWELEGPDIGHLTRRRRLTDEYRSQRELRLSDEYRALAAAAGLTHELELVDAMRKRRGALNPDKAGTSVSLKEVADLLRETNIDREEGWAELLIDLIKMYPQWKRIMVDPDKDLDPVRLNFDDEQDFEIVDEYAKRGVKNMPPIVLVPAKSGDYPWEIIDGAHRAAGARQAGKKLAALVPATAGNPIEGYEPGKTARRRMFLSVPMEALYGVGLFEGARVLDFGAGRGDDVMHLRERGVDIVGYDQYPPFNLPMPPGRFDVVTMNYVLNTIPGPKARLQALWDAWQKVRDGGILFVSTRTPTEIETEAKKGGWKHADHPYDHHDGYDAGHGRYQIGLRGIDVERAMYAELPGAIEVDPPLVLHGAKFGYAAARKATRA